MRSFLHHQVYLRTRKSQVKFLSGVIWENWASSPGGNTLRTVRSRDDLPAGRRLLVRGTAARPDAARCEGMPVPKLSACQDCSFAEVRQNKRSVKLQSIW